MASTPLLFLPQATYISPEQYDKLAREEQNQAHYAGPAGNRLLQALCLLMNTEYKIFVSYVNVHQRACNLERALNTQDEGYQSTSFPSSTTIHSVLMSGRDRGYTCNQHEFPFYKTNLDTTTAEHPTCKSYTEVCCLLFWKRPIIPLVVC